MNSPAQNIDDNIMFRTIVDAMAEGVWSINSAGQIDYVNPQLCKLLGYSSDELINRSIFEFVVPEEVESVRGILNQIEFAKSVQLVRRFIKKDRTILWTHLTSSPLLDRNNRVLGRVAIVSDISDAKRTQEEHDYFFSVSLDMLGTGGSDAYFKKLNPEFEKVLGWTLKELCARPFLDFVHPDDLAATIAAVEKLAQGSPVILFENRYRCKDGTYKWLSWKTTGANNGTYLFVARDVTDQKAGIEQLRKSAEMQSALAELGSLALQKSDLPTVFQHGLELSAKVLDMELASLSEVLPDKLTLQAITSVGWPKDILEAGSLSCESQSPSHAEYTLTMQKPVAVEDFVTEERFPYSPLFQKLGVRSGIAVAIPRQADVFGILTLHSRNTRRFSEKDVNFLQGVANVLASALERRQLEVQLKTSDRLASVGALAAGVAHEINNPLSYVITNLDLLASEVSTNKEMPNGEQLLLMVKQAQEGAERVRLVVKDLKTFSGSSDDKLVPVKLENIVDFSIRMAFNQIRYRAKLTRNFEPTPLVLVNENRLGQVVLNLLINAAQAIPEGHVDTNEIHVYIGTDPIGQALIEIIDTGSGIPAEILPRIFDPFFTTKPVGVGTGLGLSICRNIILKLKGDLSVESREGYGTKVRVVLPASIEQSSHPTVPTVNVDSSLRNGARRRILILDDEALLVETLARALSNDHDVMTTVSPAKALGLIADNDQTFDIILCDLMMAEMTGMDFFDLLKSRHPGIESRVIFMSGGTFTEQAQQFLSSTPNVRIEKPFNLKEIRALLQQPFATLRK